MIEQRQAKPREVYQPLRVALTGGTVSPGIFESVALLGREQTLRRIDAAPSGAERSASLADARGPKGLAVDADRRATRNHRLENTANPRKGS